MLRQSLVSALAVGVDGVLVTCDDDNLASARAIEQCGGVLESTVPRDGGPRCAATGSADGPPARASTSSPRHVVEDLDLAYE